MKQMFRVFVSPVLVLMLGFQTVNACSIKSFPLRKQFREYKGVFVGKAVKLTNSYELNEIEKQDIPKSRRYDKWIFSKITFEITEVWKGQFAKEQEFFSINIDSCPCAEIRRFEEGKEYLVFAEGKYFVTICDARETKYAGTKDEMKRLDSFWFRTWARIYPF